MLNYFGDVSNMTGANFTENAFKYPDNTSDEPVPLFDVFSTKKIFFAK